MPPFVRSAVRYASSSEAATTKLRHETVSRSLYRSLLRASRSFSPNATLDGVGRGGRHRCCADATVLASLLHRTGVVHDVDRYLAARERRRQREEEEAVAAAAGGEASALATAGLHPEEARDLTVGYRDLLLRRTRRSIVENEDDESNIDDPSIRPLERSLLLGGASSVEDKTDPAFVLFRALLREVLGGAATAATAEPLMRFPCQFLSDGAASPSPWAVVRREFRASPSSSSLEGGTDPSTTRSTLSSRFDDATRRRTAFLALRELNKKLRWAESLGLDPDPAVDSDVADVDRERRRRRNAAQAARNVHRLPTEPPSSYLRPGSYLVAHPLLTGFFSRTVVVILEHTAAKGERSGGTYGVVVNRPSVWGDDQASSSVLSRGPRTLQQVLRADCITEGLREAFGDSPLREGGPVNLSIQMLHRSGGRRPALLAETGEKETLEQAALEGLGIGGEVLPLVVGGKGGGWDDGAGGATVCATAAAETDDTVYFKGDIARAAQAVIDGTMDRDDFTFLVGASCWATGQLESEVERGYWLPCSGPPQMALSGMCEYDASNNAAAKTDSDEQLPRPKPDLWLSMMCALGEGEANLAHLLLDGRHDDNGEECDDLLD